MKIILASQSPRRQELLRWLVPDFAIEPADIDEEVKDLYPPKEYVQLMAKEKVALIAKKHPQELVIACDTIVALGGKVLGKPKDRVEAFQMLKQMSGTSHEVYTAAVLQQADQLKTRLTQATVTFFPLTDQEIERYLATGDYKDKAGAYGIQHEAGVFVEKIVGDYYSIVGFPVGVVNQMLKEFD